MMPDDVAIRTRIPHELDDALVRLALATGKSKSSLVCEALTAFVSSEEGFVAAVEAGRAAARAGQLVNHEEVMRDIDAMIARKKREDCPLGASSGH